MLTIRPCSSNYKKLFINYCQFLRNAGEFLFIERNVTKKFSLTQWMSHQLIEENEFSFIYYVRVVCIRKLKNFFIKYPFDEICVPNEPTAFMLRERNVGFFCCKYI